MSNGQWALRKTINNHKKINMSYKKINETKVYKLAFEIAMKIFEISY